MRYGAITAILFHLAKGMKQVKLGAIPTKNLPTKSHETKKPPERRHINIVRDHEPASSSVEKICYKDFPHFEKAIKPLKLHGWNVSHLDDNIHFKSFTAPYDSPSIEVIVSSDLTFTILVFGWSLPNNSEIYANNDRPVNEEHYDWSVT